MKSYGSGKKVKIPGPSVDKPNLYDFGAVTYAEILEDLQKQDARLLVPFNCRILFNDNFQLFVIIFMIITISIEFQTPTK